MGYLNDLRQQGLAIEDRPTWGSSFNYGTDREVYLPARYLFLHIAVVNDPHDTVAGERAVCRTVEDIGALRFPHTGISYNALAFDTGRIYDGQPLDRRGAHTVNELGVAGYPYNLNYYGHAIVLPQQVTDEVTDAQVVAVAQWGAAVVRAGYSTATRFEPHRKFAAKDCPGDRAVARLDDINRLLAHYTARGLEEADMATPQEVWAYGLIIPGTNPPKKASAGGMVRSTYSTARKTAARVGALEATVAQILEAIQTGAAITPEQVEAAAKAGAEAALAEGIDIHVQVDDQEEPPPTPPPTP